jgi:hypothetical protein
MPTPDDFARQIHRRTFLGGTAGVGSLALASLLDPRLAQGADVSSKAERWSGVVNPLHFAPKAKRLIYLYMAGGPSKRSTTSPSSPR